MKKSLYDILEVPADAGTEQIAAAYQSHLSAAAADPDPNRRVLLKDAYSILSNAQQRAAYDASLLRRATAAQAIEPAEADPPARRWPVWLLVALVVGAAIYWWQGRKKPPPVVISQTTIVEAARPAEAPLEAEVPAAATEKSAEELYAQLSGSIALVTAADGADKPVSLGSGVVVGSGTVITNCHVTRGGSQVQVRLGGTSYDATVDTADEEFDLCRLRVNGLSARPVSIGSVASLRTGQKVFAIGAPRGLELTISDGIVSSLRETELGTVIQTTAPVSPGSSGGGLFTATGQLVGIVTFQNRFGQNLNFAVPADWIGEMRNRRSTARVGNDGAGDGSRNAGAPTSGTAGAILGNWHCFGPATGRHLQMHFQPGGLVVGTSNGTPFQGRYQVTDKVLSLFGSQNLLLNIEEIQEQRMVLRSSEYKRLACDRQG